MNNLARQTAGTIRVYRQVGIARRPRKRIPVSLEPKGIRREYARALMKLVDEIRVIAEPIFEAIPGLMQSVTEDRRIDSMSDQVEAMPSLPQTGSHAGRSLVVLRTDIGESRKVRELIDLAREQFRAALNPTRIEAIAELFAQRTSTHQRIQLSKQVKAALGIDIALSERELLSVIESFVQVNVAKIKVLSEEILVGVESTVLDGVQKGLLTRDVAAQLTKKFAIGKKRAAWIARDQIGTLNGQITAVRHQKIGVDSFIWWNVGDERVRPLHRQINGQTFKYPDGHPSEGLPGVPHGCRCYSEPVFSNILRGV